ncbi:MAG: hypothetical protein QF921_07990 [Pseudomonadales bacterium]|jgi:hypothetical protein|nr:hypothetical protein [Pseudomonadales bacterium]MDP6471730.1 hypothetical protein [Pseudomonadales bacterium]MDP6971438.1 hypothetical protein [Pseudomonadales bacterium]|tara:strand:- start:1093 stop:2178 length:1086 start_codon:yes stop_codon:yes gene_type:complete
MAYIAPKDYSADEDLIRKVMQVMSGQLDLSWMKERPHPVRALASQPSRGLTLDDINQDPFYGPESIPDIVRHNFSMAPRGAILPEGLPTLGYRVNRKSDVWADNGPELFEESKARRWAPARMIPWLVLNSPGYSQDEDKAMRQLATGLTSIFLVAADVPSRWVWLMNQEFHEIKYLLCAQMFDAARLAEAFRKRALFGHKSLGKDSWELGEFLKSVIDSESYPLASAATNLTLYSIGQALGRHFEFVARNSADSMLGMKLSEDSSRPIAYGIRQVRGLVEAHPSKAIEINDHLDLVENGLVGFLGSRELIESLILMSGGFETVSRFYRRTIEEYLERCVSAGLGNRADRSPLSAFLKLIEN